MFRKALAALACPLLISTACLSTLLTPSAASAQAWASKMFNTQNHDFGTVARASKQTFTFQIKNIYKETVHITGVRSSCGCTSPRVVNPTIKTYEVGEIVAEFNTKSFLGQRGATLTVSIDKPFPAEVQLHVKGYVRSDVVFDPGIINFGSVDQGASAEQRVRVNYAGRSNWQINDIQSANHNFEVEMQRKVTGPGRIAYDLLVRLKDNSPVGYVNDDLILVTNDSRSTRIPLHVEGRVVPEITVSHSTLYLGDIPAGETVTKRLIVRGKKPFRIVEVNCEHDCFNFEATNEAKALHLVDVMFTPEQPGRIEQTIDIRVDRISGIAASLTAYANVVSTGASPAP